MITLYHFFFNNSFIKNYVCRFAFATAYAMIYAYILCNFQCTIYSVNADNRIVRQLVNSKSPLISE